MTELAEDNIFDEEANNELEELDVQPSSTLDEEEPQNNELEEQDAEFEDAEDAEDAEDVEELADDEDEDVNDDIEEDLDEDVSVTWSHKSLQKMKNAIKKIQF